MFKAICLMLVLLLPAQVFAADAHALFDQGQKALVVGRADEALKAFEASYKAQPAPSLFFWIAEAHRALGHKASAARFYRRYLARFPNGPKKAEAESRLAELQQGRGKRGKNRGAMSMEEIDLAKPAPAAPQPAPKPAPPVAALPLPSASPAPPLPGEQPAPAKSAAAPPSLMDAPTAPPAQPKPVEPTPVAPPTAIAQAAPPSASPAPTNPPPAAKGTLVAPMTQSEDERFIFVQYTARLLVPNGPFMLNYASTTTPGAGGTIYTHGLAIGLQTENFKNAVYLGFGTEDGGKYLTGTDTLLRYELSYQFTWAPLGSMRMLSPHVGVRVGAMGVKSERLTNGDLKPGVVIAPFAGLDLVAVRSIVFTAGMGYDANIGPDLGPTASISGFALDLGATVRF